MGEFKNISALVLGIRTPEVINIVHILSKHFDDVNRIRELRPGVVAYPSSHIRLIVITDLPDNRFDREWVVNLRKYFPKAKIMGLFEKINEELEINLRGVGLVFLGSYDYFNQNSLNILRSALGTGITISKKVHSFESENRNCTCPIIN